MFPSRSMMPTHVAREPRYDLPVINPQSKWIQSCRPGRTGAMGTETSWNRLINLCSCLPVLVLYIHMLDEYHCNTGSNMRLCSLGRIIRFDSFNHAGLYSVVFTCFRDVFGRGTDTVPRPQNPERFSAAARAQGQVEADPSLTRRAVACIALPSHQSRQGWCRCSDATPRPTPCECPRSPR